MIPRYEVTSLPPISTVRFSSAGSRVAAARYSMTSSIAMGCAAVFTQRGVTIKGSRSTNARIISNDALPEPMMMDAWNSMTGMPLERRMFPVSARLRM